MVARKRQPDGRSRYRFRAIVLTLGYRYQLSPGIGLQITAHGGFGSATIAAVEADDFRFHRDRERIGRGYSAGMDLGPLFGRGLFYFAPAFSARTLMRQSATVELTLRNPDRSGVIERSVTFDPPLLLLGARAQFGFRLFGGKGDLAFGLDVGGVVGDGNRYMSLFLRLGILLPEIARGGDPVATPPSLGDS